VISPTVIRASSFSLCISPPLNSSSTTTPPPLKLCFNNFLFSPCRSRLGEQGGGEGYHLFMPLTLLACALEAAAAAAATAAAAAEESSLNDECIHLKKFRGSFVNPIIRCVWFSSLVMYSRHILSHITSYFCNWKWFQSLLGCARGATGRSSANGV
jgi:hypothetical protein